MASRKTASTVTLPAYRLRSVQTHLRRILDRTEPDRKDHVALDAFRLARQDLRYLDNLLKPSTDEV